MTIGLPHWYQTLEELGLSAHMIPWNVLTHWNLTYLLLTFAVEYHWTIQQIRILFRFIS